MELGIALELAPGVDVQATKGGQGSVEPPPRLLGIDGGRLAGEVELDRDVRILRYHGGNVGVPDAGEPRRSGEQERARRGLAR